MFQMTIELLGVGCVKYRNLKANLTIALQLLNIQDPVFEIDDVETFITHGISFIPSLKINGRVISKGRIPSTDELVQILKVAKEEEK
jgi:hypothetical protein